MFKGDERICFSKLSLNIIVNFMESVITHELDIIQNIIYLI